MLKPTVADDDRPLAFHLHTMGTRQTAGGGSIWASASVSDVNLVNVNLPRVVD
jgi:hypothetical protein